MTKKKEDAETDAQREAADSLQAQIDAIISGAAPRPEPKTLRDFAQQRGAEMDAEEGKTDK